MFTQNAATLLIGRYRQRSVSSEFSCLYTYLHNTVIYKSQTTLTRIYLSNQSLTHSFSILLGPSDLKFHQKFPFMVNPNIYVQDELHS